MALASVAMPIMFTYLIVRSNLNVVESMVNAFLVMLPYFFVGKRWRWTALLPMWAVLLFVLTNAWYCRFFGDFIPLADYFLWSNLGDEVIGTTLMLMKAKDAALVAPSIATTLLYLFFLRKPLREYDTPRVWRVPSLVAGIMAFVMVYNKEITGGGFTFAYVSPFAEYDHHGLVGYVVKKSYLPFVLNLRRREASKDDMAVVRRYDDIHHRLAMHQAPDSICPGGKSLIFGVVESFNSWAIGQEVNGHKLTPVIDSLCRREGVIYAPNMVSQIHSGVSSDGQLIYNTGFYPSSDVTTVVNYVGNTYNSLAKRLEGYYSFEVISETPSMWNHRQTTKDYHFDRLFSNTERRAKAECRGKDEVIFEEAINVIDTVKKPFFAFVTTLSMHAPYKDANVGMQPWLEDAELPPPSMVRNYYNVTHYFDASLGWFLKKIDEMFPDNPPLIVIASDHKAKVEASPVDFNDYRIPLLILNTPYTMRVEHPIGQVDVMPTILALMGKDTEGCFGLPLFNNELRGALTSEGVIVGDSLSADFTDMLKLAQTSSNIILRYDLATKRK